MANRYHLAGVGNYQSKHNAREKKVLQTAAAGKELNDTFESALVTSSSDSVDGTVYTGAAGEVLGFHSGKAAYEGYVAAINGVATELYPYQSADGLEIKVNETNGPETWEITNGTTALSRHARTVGTDGSFYWEATVKIDDISDVTEIFAGFRKAEAYQLNPDDYDEMASFNVGLSADGQVEIHTILNNAATATTDTTEADWADGETHTLRIEVNSLGQCKFLYDGAEPTVTTPFTFDDGEVVVPFLHLNTETGDPGVSISAWNVGALKP